MTLQTDLATAKSEVTRIEAEIAALPETLLGKTEDELVAILKKSEIAYDDRYIFG